MNEETINFINNIDFESNAVVYEKIVSLFEENRELKKQLEEMDSKLLFAKNELEMRQKSIDNKLRQQKEFIEWLEKQIKLCKEDGIIGDSIILQLLRTILINYKEILSNYKEFIGGKDE